MIRLIKEYIKMKQTELKFKLMLYPIIGEFMNNNEEVFDFVEKLYLELKDVPPLELRKELIEKLAEYAHSEAMKQRETEKLA